MHPALVILVSVVIVQSIAAFGKDRLQNILWFLYTATFHRTTISSQRALRKEIYQTKQQLAATSSQDQFAKWAKLRRKVDKALAQLENSNSELANARSTFTILFKGVMMIITTIMPFCITSWYSKTPIFWLPPGDHSWFGPVGWFLALPRAPKGAVSSTVWQMVCSRTLTSVSGALLNLWPGNKEKEVLSDLKLEQIQQEKDEKLKAQYSAQSKPNVTQNVTASSTSTSATTATKAGAGGEARKRINAQPDNVSEKRNLV
ncbi:uncharacterized protein MEPE_02915 [Melanopsichium pennsylvanicum]|uniref:Guided entry of tail-anchored proteins 1 n=1 Tax=Melanopsichium pennsylvanicum TaxID=63383 RepID=A0AAJ4XLT7_9BASI|nr:uncharacterized protein MEPE_02915 [Melanopsichium pennsylvanicum]